MNDEASQDLNLCVQRNLEVFNNCIIILISGVIPNSSYLYKKKKYIVESVYVKHRKMYTIISTINYSYQFSEKDTHN